MSRDYPAEFDALLAKFIAEVQGGPRGARAVAERLVEHLREGDRDLLRGWLDLHAVDYIYQLISRRQRSINARRRIQHDFAAPDRDDRGPLNAWLVRAGGKKSV
jgi:hypothetical protein